MAPCRLPMVWPGGRQIKGNECHICGACAKCIGEQCYPILWPNSKPSNHYKILLVQDGVARSYSKLVNKLLYNLLLLKRRQTSLRSNLNKLYEAAEALDPPNCGHGEQHFGVAAHPHGEVGDISVVVLLPSSFTQSDGRYDTLSTLRHLS